MRTRVPPPDIFLLLLLMLLLLLLLLLLPADAVGTILRADLWNKYSPLSAAEVRPSWPGLCPAPFE